MEQKKRINKRRTADDLKHSDGVVWWCNIKQSREKKFTNDKFLFPIRFFNQNFPTHNPYINIHYPCVHNCLNVWIEKEVSLLILDATLNDRLMISKTYNCVWVVQDSSLFSLSLSLSGSGIPISEDNLRLSYIACYCHYPFAL